MNAAELSAAADRRFAPAADRNVSPARQPSSCPWMLQWIWRTGTEARTGRWPGAAASATTRANRAAAPSQRKPRVVAAPHVVLLTDGVSTPRGECARGPLVLEPGEHIPQPAGGHAVLTGPDPELAPHSRRGEVKEQRTTSPWPAAIRRRRLDFKTAPRISRMAHSFHPLVRCA